jgi:DNA-binding CsgD family transcriptional regulator
MAGNYEQYPKNTRNLLDIRLLSQSFRDFANPVLQLQDCKMIAQVYSKLENSISVLSDMNARKSYIYCGAVAESLGFIPEKNEVNSIWEDELLAKIHPDDLQKKYRLEFRFFQMIKAIEVSERTNYILITRLRLLNADGKYVLIKHRLLYLSSTVEGNVLLALCLYNRIFEYSGLDAPEGLIVNTITGEVLDSEQMIFDDVLSNRETEIIQLIHRGMRSKEIADYLSLSIHTINRHRQNIFQKLGVNNVVEACRIAAATGINKIR